MSKVYEDDVGTIFDVAVGVDLSTISTVGLSLRKPSGVTVSKLGTVLYAGVDPGDSTRTGVIRWVSSTGEIDEVGLWRVQAVVNTPSGGKFYGETALFSVYPSFDLES